MTYTIIEPRHGVGTWRVKAFAGNRSAERTLRVEKAAAPAYRVMTDRGERISVLLVGLEPGQPFALHLYDQREGDLRQRADYVTTTRGRADADGNRLFEFSTVGADNGCFVAKAEVAGQMLDDKGTQVSKFCTRLPE